MLMNDDELRAMQMHHTNLWYDEILLQVAVSSDGRVGTAGIDQPLYT